MRHCIVGVIGLVAAVPAFGQVTLLSQERSVHAVWTGGNETLEASDFSAFDATVGRLDSGFGETGALARQQSTLGPSLFTYVGEARAYRSGSLAESLLEVGFSVASPVEFNFDATMATASIFGSGALSAVLTGPDGEVFSGTTFSIPGKNREIHEAGGARPGHVHAQPVLLRERGEHERGDRERGDRRHVVHPRAERGGDPCLLVARVAPPAPLRLVFERSHDDGPGDFARAVARLEVLLLWSPLTRNG